MADAHAMPEKHARVMGYIAASVAGVGIGGVLALEALAASMCNTWGEQCSPEENAEMARLWTMALVAPVAVVGAYAVLETVVLAHQRRRRRSRRDAR